MNKQTKIDTKLLREQRDTLLVLAQSGFSSHVVEHLNGIVNFLDDTLDSVEGYGCMVLEEVEEAYNPSSDAEHDPDYDY